MDHARKQQIVSSFLCTIKKNCSIPAMAVLKEVDRTELLCLAFKLVLWPLAVLQ